MTQAMNGRNRNQSLTYVPCTDVFGRSRTVGLNARSSKGRIALVAPPGESAVMSPDEARMLAAQLLTAAATHDSQHQEVTQLASRRRTG